MISFSFLTLVIHQYSTSEKPWGCWQLKPFHFSFFRFNTKCSSKINEIYIKIPYFMLKWKVRCLWNHNRWLCATIPWWEALTQAAFNTQCTQNDQKLMIRTTMSRISFFILQCTLLLSRVFSYLEVAFEKKWTES